MIVTDGGCGCDDDNEKLIEAGWTTTILQKKFQMESLGVV